MNNNSTEKSEKQERKNDYQANLETARKLWIQQEESLVKKKEVIGYGDVALEDFITMKPDSELSQGDLSGFINLQEEFKALQEAKERLWPEENAIEELNKKHAVIHIDQFYILTEKEDPVFGGSNFSLESKQSFCNLYGNKMVRCSDGKDRSKAEIWLKSTLRKEYKGGIVFDPTKKGSTGNYYNIWKGFAKNLESGNCSLYWNHVRENICSGDSEAYFYIRKWLAYVFQKPNIVHTALVLCGSQGVGKNSFVEPLGVILGQHYLLLSNISELVSNFNFHLRNAVLIHANEALWGGHRKEIGAVKSMITEETCVIEGKGKDRIRVKNFKHLIFSSNEDWPVHIDRDDRRFFVLQVGEAHKEDHEYFSALKTQLERGGYEALLYDLLHEDISDFNPRKLPHSNASFSIKLQSADSIDRYIFEVLKGGSFDIGSGGNGDTSLIWDRPKEIKKERIFQDYSAWCINNKERLVFKEIVFKRLIKILPSLTTLRTREGAKRSYAFSLPKLEQARKDFEMNFKTENEIWEDCDGPG